MYICVCAVCAVSSIIDDANQTAIARPELVIFVYPLNHLHVICRTVSLVGPVLDIGDVHPTVFLFRAQDASY